MTHRKSSTVLWTAVALVWGLTAPTFAAAEDISGAWNQLLTVARKAKVDQDWPRASQNYERAIAMAEEFSATDGRLARTLEETARAYARQKDKARAIELQQRAVELRRDAGDQPRQLAEALNQLGKFHRQFTNHAAAEPAFREALEVRPTDDPRGPSLGNLLRDLSKSIQAVRPDDQEAEELLLRAVEADDTPHQRSELGQYYANRGDHELAIEQFRAAVQMERDRETPNLRHVVVLLTRLSSSLQELEDFDGAESALLQALAIREDHLGNDHPFIAFTLRELGSLYLATGQLSEAEFHLTRGRDLNNAAWGETSDKCSCDTSKLLAEVHAALGRKGDVREASTEIAAVEAVATPDEANRETSAASETLKRVERQAAELQERGEMEPALELRQRAVELRSELHGADSAEVARAYGRIGSLLREQRKLDPAFENFSRQLELLETNVGSDDLHLAPVLHSLGYLARDLDRHDEAEQFFLRENTIRDGVGQNLRSARVLEVLGNLNLKEDRAERAEYYFAWASDVWTSFASPEAPEFVRIAAGLGRSLAAQEKFAEAETVLEEAIALQEAKERTDAFSLVQLLQSLRTVYETAGRSDDASVVADRINQLQSTRNDYGSAGPARQPEGRGHDGDRGVQAIRNAS